MFDHITTEEFSIVEGIIVAFWSCFATRYIGEEWGWRLLFLIQVGSAAKVPLHARHSSNHFPLRMAQFSQDNQGSIVLSEWPDLVWTLEHAFHFLNIPIQFGHGRNFPSLPMSHLGQYIQAMPLKCHRRGIQAIRLAWSHFSQCIRKYIQPALTHLLDHTCPLLRCRCLLPLIFTTVTRHPNPRWRSSECSNEATTITCYR